MTRKLTPKQARFVEEYLIDLNAAQAAIRAGYAEKGGAQVMKSDRVRAAIAEALAARSEKTQIDAEWVLRRLVTEAEADISDLYDQNGDIKPVHEWPEIWRKGLVAGIDVEITGGDFPVTIKKLRLSDRLKRLELIGKHVNVNAFRENVKVDGLDDLAARLERAHRRMNEEERKGSDGGAG